MKNYFVATVALSLTLIFGLLVGTADARGRGWRSAVGCVDPDVYSYDGYQPPPMYYRAYYGDTRVCRRRWHRVHVVHSRG